MAEGPRPEAAMKPAGRKGEGEWKGKERKSTDGEMDGLLLAVAIILCKPPATKLPNKN